MDVYLFAFCPFLSARCGGTFGYLLEAPDMTAKKIQPIEVLPETRPQPRFREVVLIDDSDVDLFINETILNAVSVSQKIRKEYSPVKVLEDLQKVQRLTEVPELIFLDLNMPEMNGFEFIRRFSELPDFVRSKCKIVIVTSSTDTTDKHKALMHPSVVRFLQKPLDVYQLKDFVF